MAILIKLIPTNKQFCYLLKTVIRLVTRVTTATRLFYSGKTTATTEIKLSLLAFINLVEIHNLNFSMQHAPQQHASHACKINKQTNK